MGKEYKKKGDKIEVTSTEIEEFPVSIIERYIEEEQQKIDSCKARIKLYRDMLDAKEA